MASLVLTRVVCLAIVWLALGATIVPKAQGDVTCGQVVNNLTPCISYVVYGGATVPSQCCNGIKNLYSLAQTKPDRQAVCNCIKGSVRNSGFTYSNFNLNLAAGLPKKCGVNIPYQISPNTDCSRVQ
ncbi:non-specific lipid-transfer protein 1 [Cajanus cajan]|uniref:non-specific lipid-transfer protein 1 n=1 Tax=Cajanus cajan TaxID=3821 RepID=UPI00098D7970|nr:non-specific lipid-transfer protein 1 [Cajanus cajan]